MANLYNEVSSYLLNTSDRSDINKIFTELDKISPGIHYDLTQLFLNCCNVIDLNYVSKFNPNQSNQIALAIANKLLDKIVNKISSVKEFTSKDLSSEVIKIIGGNICF